MKRYLYILAAAAMLFVGCAKSDLSSVGDNVDVPDDGKVTLALTLKLKGAETQTVVTRAGSDWAAKENVTAIQGYAFVFGEDENTENGYGDDSPLLQKVAFKTLPTTGGDPTIYVVLDEYIGKPCFIRLMTSMTQAVQNQIAGFTSQKEITEGTSTNPVTTFKDYKHISVSLLGYYANADTPDPSNLTSNLAFPLASPGISMPNGLDEDTVADVNTVIYMIPTASKVDVSVGAGCGFDLSEVTLLNGAKLALMRSTVLENDGTSTIYSLPLPVNLGGVTQFKAAPADGKTTAATPIYFFPNEGDIDEGDDELVYDAEEDKTLSDPINGKNPTYLIVRGRAAGYNVEGYYKIAIVYKPVILGADGAMVDEEKELTYDIVRNNHYKVNLLKVDNAGYASFAEAVAAPANNIAYDIVIGGGDASTDDTFTDSRAETIVSHNGFFHVELVGSEIFAQGYKAEGGVTGSFGLSLTRNVVIDSQYDIPTLTITGSTGITIDTPSIDADNFAGTIGFTATQSGTITLRCGDMLKVIPVHYEPIPHIFGSGATIGGVAMGGVSELKADDLAVANDVAMITNGGTIAANTTYENREFRGKAYPADMSQGIRKLYVKQASDFGLTTYYDNTSASATGGISGTDDIFSLVENKTNEYQANINYQSTGKVYQVNSNNRGTLDTDKIMTNWWIGDAPINFTAKGNVTTSLTEPFIAKFSTSDWSQLANGETVTIDAGDIATNQVEGSPYDKDNAEVHNNTVLTLTNIAGESKVYNIKLAQYARPYIITGGDTGVSYDKVNNMYIWNCPFVADCYGGLFGDGYNRGDSTSSPIVYNARYKAGAEGVGDWSWTSAPNDDPWRGEADGVKWLRAAFGVVSVPDTKYDPTASRDYYFKITVESKTPSAARDHYQAYFDLKMSNGANERIFFRFKMRRHDNYE